MKYYFKQKLSSDEKQKIEIHQLTALKDIGTFSDKNDIYKYNVNKFFINPINDVKSLKEKIIPEDKTMILPKNNKVGMMTILESLDIPVTKFSMIGCLRLDKFDDSLKTIDFANEICLTLD